MWSNIKHFLNWIESWFRRLMLQRYWGFSPPTAIATELDETHRLILQRYLLAFAHLLVLQRNWATPAY